ncbi:MAG: TspO/MBR family protein [Candidatus Limnocylindrales bacterium]
MTAGTSTSPSTERLTSALVLVGFLALSFVVAAVGAVATIQHVDGWYATAQKAAWSPPNWLFGPVWTVLYTLMAVAAWLVWRRRGPAGTASRGMVRSALVIYVAQLLLNFLWTPVFFALYPTIGGPALWAALGIIVALDVAVPLTMRAFWPIDRTAALLLLPYWLWVLFATTLNSAVATMNP